MKIKELRQMLNELPATMDDQDVQFNMRSGCCGDYEELNILDFDAFAPDKFYDKGMVRFFFDAVPGYQSCIQAGGTKRAHEEYWKKHGKK